MSVKIEIDERFLKVYEAYGVNLSNPLIGIESLRENSIYSLEEDSELPIEVEWLEV